MNRSHCFDLTVYTYSLSNSKFSNWRAKLEDKMGSLYELTFTGQGLDVPSPRGDDGYGRNWTNSAWACTAKKVINFTDGFKVHVLQQWKN